jgi:hypothetical protein
MSDGGAGQDLHDSDHLKALELRLVETIISADPEKRSEIMDMIEQYESGSLQLPDDRRLSEPEEEPGSDSEA